jgi:putative transposase
MAKKNDTGYLREMLLGFVLEEDPMYSMLNWMVQQLMQVEAENKVGVSKGKHSSERSTYFSGTRVRRFDTRLGTMYLVVPKIRKGGYVPFFITEKKRSEQALIPIIQEAFINGVSTRKIERIAKKLGIENISASQVSEINKGLNQQVEEFRTRPLESEYPVLWVDAMYEKIRNNGRVISMAILIVYGINIHGKREILSIEPMYDESSSSWESVFHHLKERGLENVWLVISDAHTGISSAVSKCFMGCSWQRCKVHFMRNILARVKHSDKKTFAEKLKQIWLQPDQESARRTARIFIEEYQNKYPEAVRCLESGLEDSIQFYHFHTFDKRKIASTNVLERLIKEIRRRTRVIGVFPTSEAYIRLVTCCLIEYSEDWLSDRCYIHEEKILDFKTSLEIAV